MNQSVKLSKAISYVIIACAVLVFLAIWPTGIIHQTYVSKSNEMIAMESDPVSVENNITQMFVGEGGELSAVDLYVCNDMRGETITFRLYDASYSEIFNTFFVVKDNQKFPGFVHIPVGYDLLKDQEYYFTVEGLSADMTVAYEARETSTSIVNGFMSYGGIEIQRYNVIIRYEYSNPFVWWQVLLFAVIITIVTAGLLYLMKILFLKKWTDREVKVQNVFRVTLSPVVVVVGLLLLLMVFPGRKFGTGAMNYAFYGLGIALLTVVLLYVIHYKRTGMEPLFDKMVLMESIPEWLQAICFAGVIWSCYEYMNGLYDIHHYIATRKMLIWFLLSIICTFSKKDLLCIWNLIWLVVAGIGSYFYAKPYFGVEESEELYKLQAYIIVVGGLAIFLLGVKIIRILLRKETLSKKLCIPYVVFFAILMGMMIAFRNTRDWVIVMSVLFVIFYLRMWTWEKSDRILKIYGNGLILNFIYMVGYCMVHRPYHRYFYYRYPLAFHTVTMTSVYLTLVLCAIFARFFIKYRQKRRMADMWFELILMGTANVYLFITLSRTGYLAAIAMELFVILLFTCMKRNKRWLFLGQCLGAIIGTTVLFFPIVFSTTRILPAIANDPFYSDVEVTGYHITKGTQTDSELYMDLDRFIKIAGYKVLGINEEEFSASLNSEELMEDYFYNTLVQKALTLAKPTEVRIVNDAILLTDGREDAVDTDVLNDMTNGRLDIFRIYIDNWNLNGHEDMGVTAPDGSELVHAHNVFLQIIHDHGMITGVAFIIFGVLSFVTALFRLVKKQDLKLALTIAILLAFAAAGMAEWNFHLCNPFGPSIFVVITPLLFKSRDMIKNEQE